MCSKEDIFRSKEDPRKTKQMWVFKGTSTHSDVKATKEVTKVHWNQKSLGRKKRVLKPQVGCSQSDQKYLEEMSYVPKPNLKWVPKCFFLNMIN